MHRPLLMPPNALRLLEVLVIVDVVGRLGELKARVVPALVARGENFPHHARDLVSFAVDGVVHHLVDARLWDLLAGFVEVSHCGFLSFSPCVDRHGRSIQT